MIQRFDKLQTELPPPSEPDPAGAAIVQELLGGKYARALERLTGADLMKLFPSPRIATDAIPECRPHIAKDLHRTLCRFSPNDFQEIKAVFNGPHPETGEDLIVSDQPAPDGAPAFDLPAQEAVFAPGPDPAEIEQIAQKLRESAGLGKTPSGTVAQDLDDQG